MLKDAILIEKFGQNLRSPIPALRVVQKNLASAVSFGFRNENASAVIKALEKEAGAEVRSTRPATLTPKKRTKGNQYANQSTS